MKKVHEDFIRNIIHVLCRRLQFDISDMCCRLITTFKLFKKHNSFSQRDIFF